jgi:hypothetical protein
MRWERLFEDLEAQVAAGDAATLAAEVSERTRLERARVDLVDRLLGWIGQPIAVQLGTGERLAGRLVDAGPDWLLVREQDLALVPLHAVSSLTGLGAAARAPGADGVRRRYGLAAVLRVVARDRSPVRLRLGDGTTVQGTVDAVGADHLDLAEHPADEPRRAQSLRGVRCVPFTSLVSVAPAPGSSSLA